MMTCLALEATGTQKCHIPCWSVTVYIRQMTVMVWCGLVLWCDGVLVVVVAAAEMMMTMMVMMMTMMIKPAECAH